MMNAYDYLKSLIDDGYFDDLRGEKGYGLRRLKAASEPLLHAETTEETILPAQQEELIQHWRARQLNQPVEA